MVLAGFLLMVLFHCHCVLLSWSGRLKSSSRLFFADSCVDVEMLCHYRHGASSGPMVSRSAVLSYAVMPVTMTWSCKRLLTFSQFASVRAAWPASWWIVTGCRVSQTFLRGVHGTIFRSDSLFARVYFFKCFIVYFVYIIKLFWKLSVFHSNEFVALGVTANERTKRGWRLPN